MKRFKVLLLPALFLAAPLLAQEPAKKDAPPKASVDVTFEFASNYVFRGQDMYANAFSQDGKAYGSTNMAGSFQPDILINTPVDGMYVDIWGAYAMSHRNNVDTDGVLQYGPGRSNQLFSQGIIDPATLAFNSSKLQGLYTSLPGQINTAGGLDAYFGPNNTSTNNTNSPFNYRGGVPGFYKEDNGLRQFDETDVTFGYNKDTSIGTVGFGLITYLYANAVGKAVPATTEMFVKYALPVLPQLSLTMYNNIVNNSQYYNLAYNDSLKLGKDVTLSYGIGSDYAVLYRKQGIQDITAKLKLAVGGFFASANVANRPNMKFFDGDTAPGSLPVWLDGGSSNTDGLVADPSKNNGLVNALINYNIQSQLTPGNSNFAYTPRQKLPTNLYWFSLGYTASF